MNQPPLSLAYALRQPTAAVDGPPPSLLLLHGFGSNEQDLLGLAPHLDPRLLILSVRAPVVLQPGSYAWFPLGITPTGPTYEPAEVERALDSLDRFLDEAADAFGLDPTSLFLLGFSQGAAMALARALAQPARVAGAVVMSGLLLPEASARQAPADQLRGLPLFVCHGTADDLLPVFLGRALRGHLLGLPVDLTYREYPMGHEVSEASLRDISAWLTQRLDALRSGTHGVPS